MNCGIVFIRFLHVGQPGTTTPGPPFAILGFSVKNVLKSCRRISVCNAWSRSVFFILTVYLRIEASWSRMARAERAEDL
jgi:hypothetical protein